MIDKDPLSYSILTYGWVIALSVLGGIAGYVRKLKGGLIKRFSLVELIGEIFISAFVGIVTFYFCESGNIPKIMGAALIGISSHMGSRAIFMFEETACRLYEKWFEKTINNEK